MRRESREAMRRKVKELANYCMDMGCQDCGDGKHIPRAVNKALKTMVWLEELVDDEVAVAVIERSAKVHRTAIILNNP